MKRRRNERRVPVFFLLLMVLFGAGVIFFGWKIADYLIDSQKSENYWGDLQESVMIFDEDSNNQGGEPGLIEETDGVPTAIDFDRLHAYSPDVVAWLYIPGTRINYLIAQGEDNDYYLRRLLDGSYSHSGTPFMDYRCSADLTDRNTILYGHHMKNGSMFGALVNYSDQAFFEEHRTMYLYVPGKRYTLEPIMGYTAAADDMVYALPLTDEQREKLLVHARENTEYDPGVTVREDDRLVTLSTCSYEYGDARYVVLTRIADEK
ncbi:MAG: class B sortase [Acutalibacter sp.]|nr:class B sortase [Acutalibacter sp.]